MALVGRLLSFTIQLFTALRFTWLFIVLFDGEVPTHVVRYSTMDEISMSYSSADSSTVRQFPFFCAVQLSCSWFLVHEPMKFLVPFSTSWAR